MAMNMGKHCFCQKPMTHAIWEARRLGEIAREKKLATQMGNQGTSYNGLRKAAAMIKAGAVGNVKEVYVWTNRPIWPQGGPPPKPAQAPKHVHWDLWLGPAREREFFNGAHPFAWRGFWDFGTGALGDMACHTMNMPFMALDLRNPVSVLAETSGHNQVSYPARSVIHYEFAANGDRGPLTLHWFDGGNRPPLDLFEGLTRIKESGALIVGDKGKIYTPDDYGAEFRLMGGAEEKAVEIEESPGHFEEFAIAIKGGKPARSNFPDYAAPLTETVLLGNLAVWATGQKVEWDAEKLAAKNVSGLEEMIRPTYRDGWPKV
jgi:predicted dehydrogenase